MDTQNHWEAIYRSKAPDTVSWYRPHLEVSLGLIERAAGSGSAIIDVGGGESTLVDDLLKRGFQNVSVLDISATALDVTKERLGKDMADRVTWIAGDVTRVNLPRRSFDVWHDRAVFHFLTAAEDRDAYVRTVLHSMRPGGFVIVSTFGPEGPMRCSGLDVVRYDAAALHGQFGASFRLVESSKEVHQTPWGAAQQFLYCFCRVE